jgi:lysophospholipase L1-like esterase
LPLNGHVTMRRFALLLIVAIALTSAFITGALCARFGWPPYPQLVRGYYAVSGEAPRKRLAADRAALLDAFRRDQREFDLVLAGDSQFARGDWSKLLPDLRIADRAIDGETVALLSQRTDTLKLRGNPPIAILIGINDLVAGAAPREVCEQTLGLLDALAPSPRKLVAVLPTRRAGWNAHVAELNECLARGAAARAVPWIDAFPGASLLLTEWAVDDLHLSALGYRQLAAALAR